MDKEEESPQTTSDLWHKPSERVDVWVEEVDPPAKEGAWVVHQVHQEDHRMDHLEEITTTGTGMISRETMKAVT